MTDNLSLWDLYNKQNDTIALVKTHSHDISNLYGFSNVAISGDFNDLKNIPNTVNSINGRVGNVNLNYSDVGAISQNASCNKNWNFMLKNAQPKYVWGCADNYDMFIYDPSKFTVLKSASSDYSLTSDISSKSNNSNKLGGYTLEQIKKMIIDEVKQIGGDYMNKSIEVLDNKINIYIKDNNNAPQDIEVCSFVGLGFIDFYYYTHSAGLEYSKAELIVDDQVRDDLYNAMIKSLSPTSNEKAASIKIPYSKNFKLTFLDAHVDSTYNSATIHIKGMRYY